MPTGSVRTDGKRPKVLIVGAGPTGLAAALCLARWRLPFRLIDKSIEPVKGSRAIGLQARTLELFEQHRIVDALLAAGHRGHAGNVMAGTRRIIRLDFDPLDSRYPFLLFAEQSVTERVLTEALAAFGHTPERGVELVDFDTHGETVTANLRHLDGRGERLEVAWIIGTDGAHSTVRHRLGIAFEGETLEQSFVLADLHVEWDLPEDEFHIFLSPEGLSAIFPLGGGRYRLIADAPDGAASGGEPPTLDECQAIMAARVRHPAKLSSLGWSSRFRINSRMVSALRSGRVLLAGDAAHVHSPAGAQGMNTGIQEAMNLAWKLALVQRGAPGKLLDSYHAERHPIERDVLRQTAFVTHMGTVDRGWLLTLRDRLVPLLTALGPMRNAARRGISELSVHYRRGPLCFERLLDGGAQAGDRAPDAYVEVLDGPLGKVPSHARLFDLHDPGSFSLFVLLEPGTYSMEGKALLPFLDSFRSLSEKMGGAIRIWLVADALRPIGGPQLSDGYGQTRPVFFLWRPDGYIAARGRPAADGAECLVFCTKWFSPGYVAGLVRA
ncbi:FAD-dependent monooxygenase [Pararobbsia alpina]